MITVTDYTTPTPEDKIRADQERIAETQRLVDAAKQANYDERVRRTAQAHIYEKIDEQSRRRKYEELIESQCRGMDKVQRKIYERMMELGPIIDSSTGDKRDDARAEYSVLLAKLVENGRVVDSITFVQEPILVSTSGHGLIYQGHYHAGVVGSFDHTDWILKQDSKTGQLFLAKMSNIDKTNILIMDKVLINIVDEYPKVVSNKSPDIFPKKQELPDARPIKPEEQKKRRKFF
jgi:hypothetical protein